MKRWVFFLPLVVVSILTGLFAYALIGGVDTRVVPSALEGRSMPAFQLTAVEDREQILSEQDLLGSPYIINFWATWCPSCRWEHPYLNSLANSEGVRIIGVNYKDERDLAVTWLQDYSNPYALDIFDPFGDLGFEMGVTGAPETFFVDSKGIIQHRFQGPIDAALWNNRLKAIYDALD